MEGWPTGLLTDAYGSKDAIVTPMPIYSNSFSNGTVSPFWLRGI